MAALLFGCGGATPEPPRVARACPPPKVTVSVVASPSINPTELGAPRPLAIRVLQLKSDARIQQSEYASIWDEAREAQTLKDDLVSRVTEEAVFPSTRTDFEFRVLPDATAIAVVALFREPTGRWLVTFDLPEPRAGECPVSPFYVVWADKGAVEPGDTRKEQFPAPSVIRRIGLGGEGQTP